jgi:hypothetical protein
MEYRLIPASRDLEDQSFMRAFGREIQLDALSQFGRVDPNDIVLASVVGGASSEDLRAYLLLMDLRAALFQRLAADVEQKVTESGRSPELRTRSHALDESAPLLDAWLIQAFFGWGVCYGTHKLSRQLLSADKFSTQAKRLVTCSCKNMKYRYLLLSLR